MLFFFLSDVFLTEDDVMLGLTYNAWPSGVLYAEVVGGRVYDLPLTKSIKRRLAVDDSACADDVTVEGQARCILAWLRRSFAAANCSRSKLLNLDNFCLLLITCFML